jgi:hypothetical protein
MNKKIVLVPIIAALLVVSYFVYASNLQNPNVSPSPNVTTEPPGATATVSPTATAKPVNVNTEKIEVSNLRVDTSSDWSRCYVYFTVNNRYNSPIIAIGSVVNEINYGFNNITIPPGQTVDQSLPLPKLIITNSTSYDTKITFTFADGQYQDISQSLVPPKYQSSFFVTNESLIFQYPNKTCYSVTIQNTGSIPIVSANYTISANNNAIISQSTLPITNFIMPNQVKALNGSFMPSASFQTNVFYTILLQVKYANGSQSEVKSQLIAPEIPTPTPMPTTKPTPSPTPTLTPSPTPAPIFMLTVNASGGIMGGLSTDFLNSINLTGTLIYVPENENGQVILYYTNRGSSDFSNQMTEALANGSFSQIFKPGTTGKWQFKAYWSGDSQHSGIYSNVVSVTFGIG